MGTSRDRESVYLETSVVWYLTARPTRDLLVAAWQFVTAEWWETQRERFDLYTSDVTVMECRRVNREAIRPRRDALDGVPALSVTTQVEELSDALIRAEAIPPDDRGCATHVAVAAVHGIDYLLTWDVRRIDNARTKPIMRAVCGRQGYSCPEICSPQALMGASASDEIIRELWQIKESIAREHGYDVVRLAAYFRNRPRQPEKST